MTPAPGTPATPGGQRCEVDQLAIASDADLAALDANDGGWYYDDFSERVRRQCIGPVKRSIAFAPFATPQSGITVTLECFTSQVLPGDASGNEARDAAACAVPDFIPSPRAPLAGAIGQRCTPAFTPARGFDDSEVWLETGASDCASGLCMVYRLRGDPAPDCSTNPSTCNPTRDVDCEPAPYCADPAAVADRIYCSYRCALPGSSAAPCPAGFSCRDVAPQGGPAFAGSYCVKDSTLDPP